MSLLVIDTDNSLEYETNSFLKRLANLALIPILNSLPKNIRPLLKKSHKSGEDIITHATTHKALEVLYGHGSSHHRGNVLQNFFKRIWLSTNNSKAVRNRLKLVKREIRDHIRELIKNGKEIRMASIASGSARAIIEVLDSILDQNLKIKVTFVDKNPEAISYSRDLTQGHKYADSFVWVNDTAGNFFRTTNSKFNLIEMVGLIDYFTDEKAVSLFSAIFNSLESGGLLITANIADNSERPFVTRAVGWNMIYRSPAELEKLLILAGFSSENLKLFYEPHKIHTVVVAKK